MAHWLDDAATGLSEGRYSRRHILRRGGAIAGGALLASVTWPVAAKAGGVPCPDLDTPCYPPDFCCGGTCFTPHPDLGCCHNQTYHPSIEKCCPHGRQACFKEETCCEEDACCKHDEFCCGGSCFKHSPDVGCCHNRTYNPSREKCCPHGRQVCFKDETCCGQEECCGKGHHCVRCGTGKHLCCPDGEYCCGGVCCKPEHCKNGVCGGCKTQADCGPNAYCCADQGGGNGHCCPGVGDCCSGAPGTGLAVCCPFTKANPTKCCILGSGTAVACMQYNQVCCFVNGQLIGCPAGQCCKANSAGQYCAPC